MSSSVTVRLGQDGGSVTFSGESIAKNADGSVRWNVPGEAQIQISIPYQGEVPTRVGIQLIWASAGRDPPPELGSISAKPSLVGKTLTYSVALPVYGVVEGRQMCRIRTVDPTVGSEPLTIHDGELEIDFVKAPEQR